MKRIKIDDSEEVLILTGLIVSTKFIKDASTIIEPKLFISDASRTVARWCLDYFKDTDEAPGVHIQDIFSQKVDKDEIEEEDAEVIAKILDRISTEYERSEQFNHDYLLKVTEKYFSTEHIKRLCKDVLNSLDKDPFEASLKLEHYQSKQIPTSLGFSVLKDEKLWQEAFEKRQKPIFRMPGSLGDLINEDLRRECFIGILGTEKIGKTWNLLEFAIRAARQRCNVAFFQAGDMTDHQQTTRIGIRLTGKSDKQKYCGEILIPTYDCLHNQEDTCDIKKRNCKFGLGFRDENEKNDTLGSTYKEQKRFFKEMESDGYRACDYCRKEDPENYKGAIWYRIRPPVIPLTWEEGKKAADDFLKRMRGRDIKLHSSSGDLSIDKLERILEHWERKEGFIPDVIITDYSDLFVSGINADVRHQTNQIWKDHRFLSQRRNCLVITATQADAEAYGKRKLELTNFSEDKRKYAHVTAFYALNQMAYEKVMGIMRINHLVVREDDFDIRREVTIMRNLATGQPLIGSYF